jgi:hypothetical protein
VAAVRSASREQIPSRRLSFSEERPKMVDQFVSAMAAIALIAVLLVMAFFHLDRMPDASKGNEPSVQLAARR